MKVNRKRYLMMIICVLICIATIYGFISVGDSGYTNKDEAKNYILKNHITQTGAENAVSAIYLNYRLWDTLFEAMVLLLSAIAVISFSWSYEHEE